MEAGVGDEWRMPFSNDYNELKPLESLQTCFENFNAFFAELRRRVKDD